MTANTEPLELVTATEAARRIAACGLTLKRRIAKAGLVPDGFLLEGSTGLRSPVFVVTRLPELKRLMTKP